MKNPFPHFDLLRQARAACDSVKVTASYDDLKTATRKIWAACNKLDKIPVGLQTHGIWGHISTCKNGAARAFDALADASRTAGSTIAYEMRLNALREVGEACNGIDQAQLWARGVHELRKRDRRPMKQRRVMT